MIGYHKELKYIVDDRTLTDVRNRISGLMRPDEHQQGDHYKIRSLYFDSPALKCYRENLAGISTREKYRIRTYGCNPDELFAEVKIRHRETISKISAQITEDFFASLLSDDKGSAMNLLSHAIEHSTNEAVGDEKRVLEKYFARYMIDHFKPVVIIDYERSAFVYDICDVRITFDRNVFASTDHTRMFDANLTGRPALDDGMHILEIKYDEFLPDEIKKVLGGLRLNRCRSSKYVTCLNRFTG